MVCAWRGRNGGTRIAMISPQTPDCRGGVFAVFAKISPPTRFTIREDSPARRPLRANPHRHPIHHTPLRAAPHGAARIARMPRGHRPAGYSPSRALAVRYLRGVVRGIAMLQMAPPASATRHATSLLRPHHRHRSASAHGVSRIARTPRGHRSAGYSPSRAFRARYLRGVEQGIAALQTTPPHGAARRTTSLLRPTAAINQS